MSDYEIGYGRPPKSTRFKPGQSGNPKGRKKGSKNTYSLLRDILNQKVAVNTTDKGTIQITKQQAILLQASNQAVSGEVKAIGFIMPHMLKMDEKEAEREALNKQLNINDKQIIEIWLKNNGTKH